MGFTGSQSAYDAEGANFLRITSRVGQKPVACTIYEPAYLRDAGRRVAKEAANQTGPLPPALSAPVSPQTVQVYRRTAVQERVPRQRVWRVGPAAKRPPAPAWVAGSLVHEALAAWNFPDNGDIHQPGDGPHATEGHDYERWAEARARGYVSTDARQLQDGARRSRRELNRFQAHEPYRHGDGADRRIHEVPYSLPRDGGPLEGRINDALHLRNSVWTIVEFETDIVRDDAGFREPLAKEDCLVQARRHVTAVERLLGHRSRCILCLPNYGAAVPLYEVEADCQPPAMSPPFPVHDDRND